jgi:hypothetical protein
VYGLEDLASAIQALLLESCKRNHLVKCQYLKNSSFVPVRRENPSASEFADPYTDPATSEFFLDFE